MTKRRADDRNMSDAQALVADFKAATRKAAKGPKPSDVVSLDRVSHPHDSLVDTQSSGFS